MAAVPERRLGDSRLPSRIGVVRSSAAGGSAQPPMWDISTFFTAREDVLSARISE